MPKQEIPLSQEDEKTKRKLKQRGKSREKAEARLGHPGSDSLFLLKVDPRSQGHTYLPQSISHQVLQNLPPQPLITIPVLPILPKPLVSLLTRLTKNATCLRFINSSSRSQLMIPVRLAWISEQRLYFKINKNKPILSKNTKNWHLSTKMRI